jgi:hypothetical protein
MSRHTLKIGLSAVVLLLLVGGPPPQVNSDPRGETEIRGTLLPYFQAMRRGDLARMRPYVSDELYKNYATLFEQNQEYSRFLRHSYRRRGLAIESVSAQGDEATAHVSVKMADGSTATVVLSLTRSPAGVWQITRVTE